MIFLASEKELPRVSEKTLPIVLTDAAEVERLVLY